MLQRLSCGGINVLVKKSFSPKPVSGMGRKLEVIRGLSTSLDKKLNPVVAVLR